MIRTPNARVTSFATITWTTAAGKDPAVQTVVHFRRSENACWLDEMGFKMKICAVQSEYEYTMKTNKLA